MPKIVVIGGGTGSYTVLRGLKKHTKHLTAIVTMFDSGGSTGRLRDEFGFLPPGDIRRCLLALAPETADNLVLRQLFDYRFSKGEGLGGHSFGNLFLTALKDIAGNELDGIKHAARILNITGQVLPVTLDNCDLCATYKDGSGVRGETHIDNGEGSIAEIYLDPAAKALPEAMAAILEADLIVLGPGDLYTSVISNLLVKGIPEAIRNSKAAKVYVCNLMTKDGETAGYSAADHVQAVMKYCAVDFVLCNTHPGSPALLAEYAKENAFPVSVDEDRLTEYGCRTIKGNFITEPVLIRHDAHKLAAALMKLSSQSRKI